MEEHGQPHYAGIVSLNRAWISRARGDARGARDAGRAALALLDASSSGTEMTTARAVTAWSCAHLGEWPEAAQLLDSTLAEGNEPSRFESLAEAADIVGTYQDPDRCASFLNDLRVLEVPTGTVRLYADLVAAENLIRRGEANTGLMLIRAIPPDVLTGYPGFHLRRLISLGFAEFAAVGRADPALVETAYGLARKQRAGSTVAAISLLKSLGTADMSTAVLSVYRCDPALLSVYAEAVLAGLSRLTAEAVSVVTAEAGSRPGRWIGSLRRTLLHHDPGIKAAAARLMEQIGDKSDVAPLRRLSRELKGEHRNPDLGRTLARRVAPRVFVEDLGRIEIRIGDKTLPGTSIRRKALALLALLLAQPQMSATRDRVLDALWPDQDPARPRTPCTRPCTSLRRVFEPAYV